MKITEAASHCGLTPHTIRYYEKSGMISPIGRTSDGVRQFTPENLDWLHLLASLRETGMPTKDMRRFAQLYQRGDETVLERRLMLQTHEIRLKAQQAKLKKCRALLAYKCARYEEILGRSR